MRWHWGFNRRILERQKQSITTSSKSDQCAVFFSVSLMLLWTVYLSRFYVFQSIAVIIFSTHSSCLLEILIGVNLDGNKFSCIRFCIYLWLLSNIGVGNGSPLPYSCLETSMDRGARWAIDHGVKKSQKRQCTYVHILLHMCSTSLYEPVIFIHPVKGSTDFSYKDTVETHLCLLTPTPLFPPSPPPCNYLEV